MKGWLSVAAVVVVYDGWALATDRPTLSSQFKEASRSHPALMTVGTVYLVAHLYGVWPSKADPFNIFAAACRAL